METRIIEKELLGNVSFYPSEVLSNENEIKERNALLEKALLLGNAYRGKVRITFKDKTGETFTVFTTVWAVSPNYVMVKANRTIPVKSIVSVEF